MAIRFSAKHAKTLGAIAVLACAAGAWWFQDQWWPQAQRWIGMSVAAADGDAAGEDEHAGHDHGDDSSSIELSDQAQKNIGLRVGAIKLQEFERTVPIPALVAERPDLTHLNVATPMTGVVTHVMAVKGAAVTPGKLLFEIRLTHEDLVQAQTSFLTTLGELDVEKREIARLKSISEGIIAGKTIVQREYQRDRLEALLRAQREALLLHGLSEAQVDSIAADRRLLRKLQVFAPASHDDPGEIRLTNQPIQQSSFEEIVQDDENDDVTPLVVQELYVHKGQSVNAGEALCVLADMSNLYIEGQAFERDADALVEAANRNWTVTATRETSSSENETVSGLKIIYLDNEVDLETRAMRFYVGLPNTIVRDVRSSEGYRFVTWKYKVGQRMQLHVPVEIWDKQIVLPVAAVAREGADYFVFMQNGRKFQKRPVHVLYRDQYSVVVANDGSLFPGDKIAMSGAHEIMMALKNKSGGGGGGHAHHGHSH